MTRMRDGDLTKGPITRRLLLFALPLLLGSLVQQLYNTVDLIFAGNLLGTQASAAIGASSLLITCLVGFFGGMSIGSGVIIAQVFGAHDNERLSRALHNNVALSIAGGAILMTAGLLLAPWFLEAIGTPAEIVADGVLYLRVYSVSLFPVIAYNLGAGALRALGDSKNPLYAQIAGGLANVALDYLLLAGLNMGIAGIALATLFSQGIAAAYVLWRMTRLDDAYALRARQIAFDVNILRRVLSIGVPAGAQSLVITLSNVVAQYFINSLGTYAIAAFAAYFKIELIIYLPIVAFGQAIMTFAGQNFGAGEYERIRQGTLRCAVISMAIAGITSVAALATGWYLFRIFNGDPAVIEQGQRLIGVTFPFYFTYCILQIFGDSMRGLGKSRTPMVIILTNICVIRTLLLFAIVPGNPVIESVGITYPITWALTSACMLGYYAWHHVRRLGAVSFAPKTYAESYISGNAGPIK